MDVKLPNTDWCNIAGTAVVDKSTTAVRKRGKDEKFTQINTVAAGRDL